MVLVAVLILSAAASMAQTPRPGDTLQLWEYRTEAVRIEARRDTATADSMLNGLGQQGWELVAVTRREIRIDDALQTETLYLLKRPGRVVNR